MTLARVVLYISWGKYSDLLIFEGVTSLVPDGVGYSGVDEPVQ
jgi:hypothetical protein